MPRRSRGAAQHVISFAIRTDDVAPARVGRL